jgi:uncharacterized protein
MGLTNDSQSPAARAIARRHPGIPPITPENEAYWTGGAAAELQIRRCQDCRFWVEGPSPLCPSCWGERIAPEPTSGRGFVYTYTIIHNVGYEAWGAGKVDIALPYVAAIVELRDQPGLRLTTNVVGCGPDEVRIGMSVRVIFESGEYYIPLFEPEVGEEGA